MSTNGIISGTTMTEKSATFGDDVSITEAIIETVCKLQGIEPDEFGYVLYDWIDPDALTKLLRSSSSKPRSVTVEFSISEFQITICSDPARDGRTVTVQKPASEVTTTGLGEEGIQGI